MNLSRCSGVISSAGSSGSTGTVAFKTLRSIPGHGINVAAGIEFADPVVQVVVSVNNGWMPISFRRKAISNM